jgi:hypothetical protein
MHSAESRRRRDRFGWLRRFVSGAYASRRIIPAAYYLVAREAFTSDEEMASILGVDEDALARWARGEADADDVRLLRDVSVVVSELLAIYEPEAVREWLQGRAPGELKTPIEWLREGNLAEVLNQINASATGAYS